MDKATPTTEPLSFGIHQMLARSCRGQMTFISQTPSEALVATDKTPLTSRGYVPARHRFAELVLGISGTARLGMADRIRKVDGKRIVIILPGAAHAETFDHSRHAYRLLWTAILPTGLSFFVSRYDPGMGFLTLPDRFSLQTPHAEVLWTLAGKPDLGTCPREKARFQAKLIETIGEVLDRMGKPQGQTSYHRQLIAQIRSFIDQHFTEPLTVVELARIARCTPNYLNTIFRKEIGQSIHQYLLQKRLDRAIHLLRDANKSVKETAYLVGFKDPLYFSRLFRRHTRHCPSGYKSRTE